MGLRSRLWPPRHTPLTCRTPFTPGRCWIARAGRCRCEAADVVGALVDLLEAEHAHGRVFNVGGTEEISIKALAERIVARVGSSSPIRTIPYDEACEAGFEDMPRRVPDLSRAAEPVGFAPRRDLDAVIAELLLGHLVEAGLELTPREDFAPTLPCSRGR